jgi:hypothetical protein
MLFDAAKTFDTHNALNTATGGFVSPESGYYKIDAGAFFSAFAATIGQVFEIGFNKNAVNVSATQTNAPITGSYAVQIKNNDTIYLAKGDVLSVYVYQGTSASKPLHTDPRYNYLSIVKVSGIN